MRRSSGRKPYMKRKNQILGITSILLSAVAFIMISRMAAAFSLAPKDPGPRLYPPYQPD